eukprot:CAMPEP_0116824330 /NCGR_PEP_ID=MMETSP0418-20121206/1334_1 /TAXON_ID=1158023 /ORGANISM="Astrosyne radiata, Strain 13vi08-1A" /LENGTH=375 /DNA_ID=CAMNT_0004452683 /DNA_START=94 /DNA_END=1221 /DNA_ORIENTATION=+
MDVAVGYRKSHVRLPTTSLERFQTANGDSVVHYDLLTDSIFSDELSAVSSVPFASTSSQKVGYIRLTRFSRAATAGFLHAIESLEQQGAQSYIIDIRNNYGGVIQEALLTAASLLRDPHCVLCYTMNARGGFTPHDAEEYIVDSRYPGYLLSDEAKTVTLDQVRRESPEMFEADGIAWTPPSSFASLHEQVVKRGIHLVGNKHRSDTAELRQQLQAQKKIVLLINEGTASSAEVFASSLHDNGRTVSMVGTKTFGKGLIQHTFPMPDGGGLRLTVAEYLTPALHHVTNVGAARYDRSGTWVGGGIRPDVYCESKHGIPRDVGADLCVGAAMDALKEAAQKEGTSKENAIARIGGSNDGSGTRQSIKAGVVPDSLY